MPPFIPYHVHSHYSLLEGVDSPAALVERAAACGYSALALTDTNNLYGAVPFVEAAREHGIRPILGACLRQGAQRCTAIVAEPGGYRSLCRILSEIHLGPARPLAEVITEYADGLHFLIDDPDFLAEYSAGGMPHAARGTHVWLEIIRPRPSLARERRLLELGTRLGLKPIASVAAHFTTPAGYADFQLGAAVRLGILLDQMAAKPPHCNGRASPVTPAHHLVDAETLYQRFADLPEAIVNTERLGEVCRSDVLPRGIVLPPARVPRAHDAAAYLRLLCERGLRRRIEQESNPQGSKTRPGAWRIEGYRDRLKEELHIINQRDLAGYFLVVRGIARDARRRGYPMALRGSAGNSLVCYLLGITNVDPLRFGLPLERFLHAGRPDLPDIDLDFDWKVRDEVIARVFARYGDEHTAMISTHQFLQPASAFREAAKVHGLSNEQISRLLEQMDSRVDVLTPDATCGFAYAHSRNLHAPPKSFPQEPERWPRLLVDAQRLIGRPHHLSIHPGGVVITPGPIADYVPLQRAAKGVVITQFEKDAIEQIGLVKIDLLGNRALATVSAARKLGVSPRAEGEPAALRLLQTGDTLGVNQLESPAMRHLLIQMRPRGLMDVIQALALIRPGAASVGCKELFIRRRHGLEPVTYPHSILEPVLRETEGLMLYEDDAMHVVQALTGVSAPEADRLRKQITKCKSDEEALAVSKVFLNACVKHGLPVRVAEAMWVQIAKFNSYSFCKSHAVSYGLIAWEAVQLKAEHPALFWVAALNNNQGMYPRRVYVEAAKRMGIHFMLPCVNQSEEQFSLERHALSSSLFALGDAGDIYPRAKSQELRAKGPERTAIRTGLALIRNLDEETREAILADRRQRGPFRDLPDFRRRVPCGPETLAILIQVGAFDFTGLSRAELMLEAELAKKALGSSLLALGDAEGSYPRAKSKERRAKSQERSPACDEWIPPDYSQARRWRDEWELLGFIIGPPLMQLFRSQVPSGLDDSRCLRQRIGKHVRLAGLVATGRHTPTKQGENMQFVTLEDEWGLVELTLFPSRCQPVAYLAMGPYVVNGVVEEQYGVVTVTAERFERAMPLAALRSKNDQA
jgi:DNA-directed DNA polymerase III PolC